MSIYEVVAQTKVGIYAEVVTAANAASAIKKARPTLRDLARGYELTSIRAIKETCVNCGSKQCDGSACVDEGLLPSYLQPL